MTSDQCVVPVGVDCKKNDTVLRDTLAHAGGV